MLPTGPGPEGAEKDANKIMLALVVTVGVAIIRRTRTRHSIAIAWMDDTS
jgi:hypothetical protein